MRTQSKEWRIIAMLDPQANGSAMFAQLTLLGATEVRIAAKSAGVPGDDLVTFAYWVRWPRHLPAPEAAYEAAAGEQAPFTTKAVSSTQGEGAEAWKPFGR